MAPRGSQSFVLEGLNKNKTIHYKSICMCAAGAKSLCTQCNGAGRERREAVWFLQSSASLGPRRHCRVGWRARGAIAFEVNVALERRFVCKDKKLRPGCRACLAVPEPVFRNTAGNSSCGHERQVKDTAVVTPTLRLGTLAVPATAFSETGRNRPCHKTCQVENHNIEYR